MGASKYYISISATVRWDSGDDLSVNFDVLAHLGPGRGKQRGR
jgi:hypothetical protein